MEQFAKGNSVEPPLRSPKCSRRGVDRPPLNKHHRRCLSCAKGSVEWRPGSLVGRCASAPPMDHMVTRIFSRGSKAGFLTLKNIYLLRKIVRVTKNLIICYYSHSGCCHYSSIADAAGNSFQTRCHQVSEDHVATIFGRYNPSD